MEVCQRCKKEIAIIRSRKESFCNKCFTKFVSVKQRKRMMGDDYYRSVFKVVYNKDGTHEVGKAVMGFDFQSSCLVALDIIIELLREQYHQHRGRVGFTLDIVSVYQNNETLNRFKDAWEYICSSERYSNDRILDYVKIHFINADTFYHKKNLIQILVHNINFDSMALDWDEKDNYSIEDLLKACPNRNTRSDFWNIIVQHTVKQFAMQTKCSVLIWGNSMTKLADQILGLVIKGRGANIAASLDSESLDKAYGNIFKNLYPMKDVLLSEIDAYIICQKMDSLLVDYTLRESLIISDEDSKKENVNSTLVKNMSINELVRKYYEDMEGEYSNIISTVLRTGDKLQAPTKYLEEGTIPPICSICSNVIYSNSSVWLKSITVDEGHPIETKEEKEYYKQWKESKMGVETEQYLKLKDYIWNNGDAVPLCYGCTINLNGIKGKNVIWPRNTDNELQDILDEYQINADDE